MKKLVTTWILLLILTSCGISKTVRTSKKVIKGNWTLKTITYSESGTYNISLLNDASKECFEGSQWQFIPNNNTGNYIIDNANCTAGSRYFIFTIDEIDETTGLYDFLLKPTNEKGKSQTNAGFRMNLSQLSDTNMQWKQTVSVDGNPFVINMNFIKQQ
ncbi:lipocalin family protein [Winogradskyella sp.]|uniref:lipocalin family protein n=1 Tax=Winogradskyella sp. TaxID=1883156 RepID=UPI0026342FE3|nr:lipocalin family protein [Winogradskyella sp.]